VAPETIATAAELAELRRHLAGLIAILDEERDSHWSRWMRDSDSMLAKGDLEGITHFLGAFGGMGSFNDLASERSLAVAAIAYRLASAIKGRFEDPS